MITTLDNGILQAQFDVKGAEMTRLSCGGIERIWCGDPTVWPRHAPLLFPIIGRLLNGQYELNGEPVSCPTHGFCRDRIFGITAQSSTLVRFETSEDEETKSVFPYDFDLAIEYELRENTLVKRHIVTNRSDCPMYFEIGGHDAYNVAMLPGETASDYAVAFEETDRLQLFGMEEGSGMLTLPKSETLLENGMLRKMPWELGLDTLILEDLPVRKAKLVGLKSGLSVEISFEDFPYLGIWTKPVENVRYLCIEPWTTLPDGYFMSRNIEERPGICTLQPGETRTWTYTETFA